MINESNSHFFDELAQDYEDEFSLRQEKEKLRLKHSIEVDLRIPNVGYYWKESSVIVGFSIVESIDGYCIRKYCTRKNLFNRESFQAGQNFINCNLIEYNKKSFSCY